MLAPSSNKEENEAQLNIFRKAVEQQNSVVDATALAKKKDIDEYKALMKRLEDLPKKLQHHIMVPFGSVGYMPGRIVKTNEVMMLLGDGYFVERSCHEANEAIQRRIETLNKWLKDCVSEKKILNDQLRFAEQLYRGENKEGAGYGTSPEEVEIREEYDEAKEAAFREKRKARVGVSSPSASCSQNEMDIIKRLEELELLEEANDELRDDEDNESTRNRDEPDVDEAVPVAPPGVSKEEFEKLLKVLDENTSDEEYMSDEDEDYDDEDEDEVIKADVVAQEGLDSDDLPEDEIVESIAVSKEVPKKNKPKRKRSVHFAEELEQATPLFKDQPASAIKPAEPEARVPSGPILRNADAKSPCDPKALAEIEKVESGRRIIPSSKDAFSGIVVERVLDAPPPRMYNDYDSVPGPSTSRDDVLPSTNDQPKKVSKFKMQRSRR